MTFRVADDLNSSVEVGSESSCLLTPDTILRWYRQLMADKYDGTDKRVPGRPRTAVPLREMLIRFAKENPAWGYTRLILRKPIHTGMSDLGLAVKLRHDCLECEGSSARMPNVAKPAWPDRRVQSLL
jgi:hypothetical protein